MIAILGNTNYIPKHARLFIQVLSSTRMVVYQTLQFWQCIISVLPENLTMFAHCALPFPHGYLRPDEPSKFMDLLGNWDFYGLPDCAAFMLASEPDYFFTAIDYVMYQRSISLPTMVTRPVATITATERKEGHRMNLVFADLLRDLIVHVLWLTRSVQTESSLSLICARFRSAMLESKLSESAMFDFLGQAITYATCDIQVVIHVDKFDLGILTDNERLLANSTRLLQVFSRLKSMMAVRLSSQYHPVAAVPAGDFLITPKIEHYTLELYYSKKHILHSSLKVLDYVGISPAVMC